MERVSVKLIKRRHRSTSRRKSHQEIASENVLHVRLTPFRRSQSLRRTDTTRTFYSVQRMGMSDRSYTTQQTHTIEQSDAISQNTIGSMTAQEQTNRRIIHINSSTSAQSVPVSVKQKLSSNEEKVVDLHAKSITPTISRNQPSIKMPSASSSAIKPFDSISRLQTAASSRNPESVISLSQIGSTNKRDTSKWERVFHNRDVQISDLTEKTNAEEHERDTQPHRRRRRRRIGYAQWPSCCNCCCALLTLLLALLLCGLAALFVALFGFKRITTTTATETTTTATTSTSTSTTTTTTTTTPTPPCTPTNVGSSSTLLSMSSITSIGYTCYSYQWTAPITGTVTLAFLIRNDPDYTYLDDVSVYNGPTQVLVNGGFETGSLSPWVTSYPQGPCGGVQGQVCSSNPHSGSYDYCDGCNGLADQVSQSFTVTAGNVYVVSFWMGTGGTGPVISTLVTLQ